MENNNVKTERLDAEAIDTLIAANASSLDFKDLFTSEQRDKLRAEYCRKFDEAWAKGVSCATIATIRGVSTSSVVSFFNNDVNGRTHAIAETIEAIGSGKPRKSVSDKIADLLKGVDADTRAKIIASLV